MPFLVNSFGGGEGGDNCLQNTKIQCGIDFLSFNIFILAKSEALLLISRFFSGKIPECPAGVSNSKCDEADN